MEQVLAVDLGTGGPKVGLVRADGTVTADVHAPTRLLLGPGGAAEQDPDDWWSAVTRCVRTLLADPDVDAGSIAAVAVTGQWSGTVPVGADGRPVAPALIWMDSRGARYADEVTSGVPSVSGFGVGALRSFLPRAGGLPSHSGKDPTAHILWLRHERPDVYAATRTFLEPIDYLVLRLTGRACSSYDTIALHWVTDNRDLDAVRYDDELVRRSGLDRDRLPELVAPAGVVGALRASVVEEWGLPRPVPVVTATPDIHSAVLGSGAVADHAAHLYLGTSAWLACHVPAKGVDLLHNQTTVPAALPGRYLLLNEHETAGACLDWLMPLLGIAAPADGGYAELETLAGSSPAGAGGVMFTPWLNGERTPVDDSRVRASYLGLSLVTSRADLARATYEGVALDSRWLLEVVQRFVRRRLPELTLAGGGALSPLWAQIHADALGLPVRRLARPRLVNVRGAGFLALVALHLADLDELARAVPVAEVHRPDPRHRATYDAAFTAFRDAYRRTRPGRRIPRARSTPWTASSASRSQRSSSRA